METLSKSYEELYHKNKDFDARLFLTDDETLSPIKTEAYVLLINPPLQQEPNENSLLITQLTVYSTFFFFFFLLSCSTNVEMTPRKNPSGEESVSIPQQTPIR